MFQQVWTDIHKQPKSETSIEIAANTVRSQGQENLKLTESAVSYQFIASPGITKIGGKNYYTVRTYKRLPDNTLSYTLSLHDALPIFSISSRRLSFNNL